MHHKDEDSLQSMHAQTAHIQVRILHMATRGEVSDNILREIAQHAREVADRAERAIKRTQSVDMSNYLDGQGTYAGASAHCDARPFPKKEDK